MPRLETASGWARLKADLISLVSASTDPLNTRFGIFKSVLLRSVRLTLAPSTNSTTPLLPLRIRPAFVILNIVDLILLGILGFHPRGQTWLRINDKILHFICFFLATAMFYMIWDVDEPARASYLWRNASLILTGITCFLVGGIGSEIVQSLLPYKQFQLGDIIANLLGSSLGLFFSYHLEKRYRARRELERLYAPLDAEDYGDLDQDEFNDEEELGDVRGGSTRSNNGGILKKTGAAGNNGGGKKKARFDNNIWDDSVDIDPLPSTRSSSVQKTNRVTADPLSVPDSSSAAVPKRREDLFSIDDDESDEDGNEAQTGIRSTSSEEVNVWKQADA
ncbi:uncharacterized protein MEPE_03135 [Melanopsichium pennsylvanicum]|uniref:VanZ-like domain-containing protein n=2 Tax=Melanopsichium pennsylvanicum TaxID=63383 RepID=A0AAJ4XM24_9BASI|nr:conserved hypothetical protein [Melanopsichium pennsylvanicum 4]SNX84426.1 uncharacterized protein MEPE_03135 [Melanopsichium pennsylvanicum]